LLSGEENVLCIFSLKRSVTSEVIGLLGKAIEVSSSEGMVTEKMPPASASMGKATVHNPTGKKKNKRR